MLVRSVFVAAGLLVAGAAAAAETMNAEAARRFVLGKVFNFTCFDGTRGAGRIYGDGSVIGTVQFNGSGPIRNAMLPPGTLHVKGGAVCATLRSMPIEPCFNLTKLSEASFRGAVSGLGFAYCDFIRKPTPSVVRTTWRLRPSQPLPLDAGATAGPATAGSVTTGTAKPASATAPAPTTSTARAQTSEE
jgi:hypothetical protein